MKSWKEKYWIHPISTLKQIKRLLPVIVGLLFFSACNSQNKGSEATTDTATSTIVEPTLSETQMEVSDSVTATERIKGIPNVMTNGTTGGNANILNETSEGTTAGNTDFTALYSELEMTTEQIDDFQNAMKDYQDELGGNDDATPTTDIDTEMEKHLKNILTDQQFEKYKTLISRE